jgi:nitroimidazol reductase NimA-like FMN-containing flavoprotein (pyridoxamine 5'-phosphate oxidase superfamily)
MPHDDLAATGHALIEQCRYMVLASADASGTPWSSPVYFAPVTFRELVWVSRPEARHSRNIAQRAEVSLVVFDSSAPIGTGTGVYIEALAAPVAATERDAALAAFSRRSLAHGGRAWDERDVSGEAALRLYRASAVEQFVLGPDDRRVPVTL